jgi:long-chain acyl-CoA synthetase
MDNLLATGGVTGPGRIGRVAIGDLLKHAARRFPDRIALTDGNRRVTFTEIERDANRFANCLVQRGLKPGEKISTICNNSVEFVKALFGIHRAGLVWVPINTMPGAVADEAGIEAHCRQHLGGSQVPKLVRILEEMPMTATGKLRKVELRQAYSGYFAEPA